MHRITLQSLEDDEAADLLISNCNRRLTHEDFNLDEDTKNYNIVELLKQSSTFKSTKNMPEVILDLAKELGTESNSTPLCHLKIEKDAIKGGKKMTKKRRRITRLDSSVSLSRSQSSRRSLSTMKSTNNIEVTTSPFAMERKQSTYMRPEMKRVRSSH